jgi:glycosyltransferase involved in cell wall biosynthesis
MSEPVSPKVAFLTHDYWKVKDGGYVPGGVAWVRCYQPMKFLGAVGWKSMMSYPDFNEEKGFGAQVPKEKISGYGWDVVVLKGIKEDRAVKMVKRARELGQRVIVDVDDLITDIHHSNKAKQHFDPEKNKNINYEHHEEICANADMVTVTTPILYQHYRKFCKHVEIIRNGIDYERYPVKIHTTNKPKIGWVGSTSWRSNDLWTLSPFMTDLLRSKKLKFHHSGHALKPHKPFWEQAGVAKELVDVEPGVATTVYPRLFNQIDIGVVPLNLPLEFNEAKSALKGLEYAASGIPFVASPSGEYKRLASMGIGRIASTPDEWISHLTELLDPEIRQAEATRQRELLVHHSAFRRGFDWLGALSLLTT